MFPFILLALLFAAALTTYRILKKQETYPAWRITARYSALATGAALIVYFLYAFVLGVYIIPSKSMVPTLLVGDRIIVNKFVYTFHKLGYMDVIVFNEPKNLPKNIDPGKKGDNFVKRVIGLPGDTLSIQDGAVYRNGQRLNERYVKVRMIDSMSPRTVPQGTVFVMGDNRNDSFDSRDYGPIEQKTIIGRANLIISPLKRFRYIK